MLPTNDSCASPLLNSRQLMNPDDATSTAVQLASCKRTPTAPTKQHTASQSQIQAGHCAHALYHAACNHSYTYMAALLTTQCQLLVQKAALQAQPATPDIKRWIKDPSVPCA
jgi:hypothetical protein